MKLLTCSNLSTGIRIRILKTYIWSVILYVCETWSGNREMMKKLEAAEMWFIRRLMRVPWVARRTNQEVLLMAGTNRELMSIVRKRQLRYLEHVLRGEGLERDCLMGLMEGKRTRGRQRKKYTDGIKEMVGREKLEEVVELAGNRRVWHYIVANVD